MSKSKISANEITDKLQEGSLSRRQFNKMLSAAGVGLVMSPLAPSVFAAAKDQATYFTWGGYNVPELFAPYIAKHGEPPNFAVFGGSEEGLTKMRAGYIVDVAHPCNQAYARWIATGLYQPLDTDRLSNWGDLIPALRDTQGSVVDGRHYVAPMEWGQTSITYRTDMFDLQGQEESWGMLWDERYKGRLGVIASGGDTWWCAAIYAGVPFAEMDTKAGMKTVGDLLRKQRPLIRLYTDDMTTLEQALASGELVAAMTWNESPVNLKKQGVAVKFADPKEGALTWVCGTMMHKDAPHPDKAYDVVNSLISVETGVFIIDEFGYGHSNIKAFDAVPEERLAELGLTRDPEDMLSKGKFQIPMSQEFETTMNSEFETIKAGF